MDIKKVSRTLLHRYLVLRAIFAAPGDEAAQKGQGLAEYALILVLIAIVVITTLTALGVNINDVLQQISDAL